MLLQSADNFNEVIELNPISQGIIQYSKQDNPELGVRFIEGFFATIDSHMVFLYRYKGFLYLKINGNIFKLDKDVSIDLIKGSVNTLIIRQNGLPIFNWTYRLPKVEPMTSFNPTPFIEEEDFDFGLFVCNVLNDSERKERIFKQ